MFNISKSLSGQQIVSVLADKLTPVQYKEYKPFMILELSQSNKYLKFKLLNILTIKSLTG
jgi:hypothetical protein